MRSVTRVFGLAALIVSTCVCLAQSEGHAEQNSAAQFHARDSYVLVLNKDIIQRGPDFSQRELALKYQKNAHVRDFIWFFTVLGRPVVAADSDTVRTMKEFEKTQQALNRKWATVALHPGSARQLGEEQNRHTAARDEFVWGLYDKLKSEGRLLEVTDAP